MRLRNCWRSSCDRRRHFSFLRAREHKSRNPRLREGDPSATQRTQSGLPMASLPPGARYVVIGAGIHGLSPAMHLAGRLRAKGMTVGAGTNRIVVLDKTGICAGASGIASGGLRNNYYPPAMPKLM